MENEGLTDYSATETCDRKVRQSSESENGNKRKIEYIRDTRRVSLVE